MNIQSNSKLIDIFNEYPNLEQKIIGAAPTFENLKNSILKETVSNLITVEKVAQIGDLDVTEFVNLLRKEVGLSELGSDSNSKVEWKAGEPEWLKGEPHLIIDGTEMLSQGVHPLEKVNQTMNEMEKGRYLLLRTNFKPAPLIDAMQQQNYEIVSKTAEKQPDQHFTFVRK